MQKIIERYASNFEEISEILFSEELLINSSKVELNNILPSKKIEYPLTTITIELTNLCSLNCIHCYGAFGRNTKRMEYSLEEIQQLKKEFDYLHVRSIVLTGGDLFLNNDTVDIVLYLLENGFKVTVLTNGWADITTFCQVVKDYQLAMIFSLDGLEETHDFIRGRREAFTHAMKAIEVANMYDNISIGINITIMRKNISEVEKLEEYIKKLYPNISINKGLIIPVEGIEQSFRIDEFEHIHDICPSVLRKFDKGKERIERCQGGITLCSLDADRNVTICAAARGSKFLFGNIYDRELSDIWVNPPVHISQMRSEKHLDGEKCRNCNKYEKCKNIQDCRIYAEGYSGDISDANPICCFIAGK